MTDLGTAAPYIAVYLLFEKEGKYAFVKRANTQWMDGFYGFPAGKVEKGESFTAAAVREASEEVAVIIQPEAVEHLVTVHRKSTDMYWVDVAFRVKSWEGELINAEPHMHSELVWLDKDNLPEKIVPNNRFIIEQIHAGSQYAEYGWCDASQI